MSDALVNLRDNLQYIRDYLVKIGPDRRQKDKSAVLKLEEAKKLYSNLENIVSQVNQELKHSFTTEKVDIYNKLVEEIKCCYSKIVNLMVNYNDSSCQTDSDSTEHTKMANEFDLKIAISLLPAMTGQEKVTKQLIDSILLYKSMISTSAENQLIQFVLKTRLSESAKLRLKPNYSSVDALVSDIRKYLLPKKSPESIQSQLYQAKQGRRSIENFGSELEELFVNLTLAQADEDQSKFEVLRPINEKAAIKRFADGLSDPRLSTIIASRQFTSLPEAIRTAIDEQVSSSQYREQAMHFSPVGRSYTNGNRGKNYFQRPKYNNSSRPNYYRNNMQNSANRGHRTSYVASRNKVPAQQRSAAPPRSQIPRVQHAECASTESTATTLNENKFFRA
ncbi:hypothetical protein ABMA28_007957 [Loxostege sticticalis]|uniref:Retrotransposon gag domain-containing protein n=1 Tax=Loxostege sticticalis TaxID=481309 RepID=A0ABD0SJE0_LOXSC